MLRDVRALLDQECANTLGIMVTFTEVEVTADLKYATIYYSVLGDDDKKKKVADYLAGIRGRAQTQLGRQLRIKYIPEITFRFDPSIEHGLRIEQLLKEISKDNEKGENGNIR